MSETEDRLLETVTSGPTQKIPWTAVKRDGGTQTRAKLDSDTVTRYADDMRRSDPFPRIIVYYDGQDYWLADGFHRMEAALQAFGSGCEIDVEIRQGTRRDAVLHSAGANAQHGLPRSNDDKRRAVQALLADDEWSLWSDRQIAETTHTTHPFVGKIRAEMFPDGMPGERQYIRDGEERTMHTGAINAGRAQPVVTPEQVTDVDRANILALLAAEGPIHMNVLTPRARADFNLGSAALVAVLGVLMKEGKIERGPDTRYQIADDSQVTTRTSRHAEKIAAFLAAQPGGPVSWKLVMTGSGITKLDDFSKAVNLLEASGRIAVQTHATAGKMFTLVPPAVETLEDVENVNTLDDDTLAGYGEVAYDYLETHGETHFDTLAGVFDLTPGELSGVLARLELQGKVKREPGMNYRVNESASTPEKAVEESDAPAVPSILRHELDARFDQSQITLLGRSDNGAWHRAIEVARKLVAAAIWDGSTRIEFDAYALHDKLFGANRVQPSELNPGQDYTFRFADGSLTGILPDLAPNGRNTDPGALVLSILHSISEPLTAPQIANAIEDRMGGKRMLAWVLKQTLSELLIAGEIVSTDPDAPGGFPLYTLAEKAAVPFKTPSPTEIETPEGMCEHCHTRRSAYYSDEFGGEVCEVCAKLFDNDEPADPKTLAPAEPESAAPAAQESPRDEHPPRPRYTPDVQTYKDLIIDALRKSQRGLGRATELRKEAGIGTTPPEIAAYHQAVNEMLDAGSLTEWYQEGVGKRVHFPDVAARLNSKSAPAETGSYLSIWMGMADRIEKLLANGPLSYVAIQKELGVSPNDQAAVAMLHRAFDLLNGNQRIRKTPDGYFLMDRAAVHAYDEFVKQMKIALGALDNLPDFDPSTLGPERIARAREQVDDLLRATGNVSFRFREIGREPKSSEPVSAYTKTQQSLEGEAERTGA